MEIKEQIEVVEEAMEKLQKRFAEAVKKGDAELMAKIDVVLIQLEDGKKRLEVLNDKDKG